jgi:hypothetical protein
MAMALLRGLYLIKFLSFVLPRLCSFACSKFF